MKPRVQPYRTNQSPRRGISHFPNQPRWSRAVGEAGVRDGPPQPLYVSRVPGSIREAGAGALRTRLLLCMPAGMSEAEETCLWGVSQRSGTWRPSCGARAADREHRDFLPWLP